MIIQDIVSLYSKALFNLAPTPEALKNYLVQLETFCQLVHTVPVLQRFLQTPHISNQEKKKVLHRLLHRQFDKQLLHFLFLLLDKGRFKYLAEIKRHFQNLIQVQQGILTAQLTVAYPIPEESKEKLRSKLEEAFDKKIDVKEAVDPSIIGGMIIAINNLLFDTSIKSRLVKLKEDLVADHV